MPSADGQATPELALTLLVEEGVVELEDCVPCLIARALRGVLGVAVTVPVEFFRLQ